MPLYKFQVRNSAEISNHKKLETAQKFQKKHGGKIFQFIGYRHGHYESTPLFIEYKKGSLYK